MALPLGLSRVSVTWFQNWPVYGPISKANPYFGPTFTIFEADGLKWWKWPVLRKTGRLFKVGVLWAYVDVHGPEEIEIRLEMDGIKVLKRFRLSNRFNMTVHLQLLRSSSWTHMDHPLLPMTLYFGPDLVKEVSCLKTKECVLNQAYRLRE